MVHCENTPFRRLLCNMNIKIRNITSALSAKTAAAVIT